MICLLPSSSSSFSAPIVGGSVPLDPEPVVLNGPNFLSSENSRLADIDDDEDSGRSSGGGSDSDKENVASTELKNDEGFAEEEKSSWRRLLVHDGSDWRVEFVSPEGQRFSSYEDLASHLSSKGIDPSTLHWLNKSPSSSGVLSVTFCSMRQNIVDMRRQRRGRKRSRDSAARSASTDSRGSTDDEMEPTEIKRNEEDASGSLPAISEEETIVTDYYPLTPSPASGDEQEDPLCVHPDEEKQLDVTCSIHEEEQRFCSNFLNPVEDPLSSGSCTEDDSEELDLRLSDNDMEEEVAEYYLDDDASDLPANFMPECCVQIVDLFRDTPVGALACQRCSRAYDGGNDISVNFRSQTVLLVCRHCRWWTTRQFGARQVALDAVRTDSPDQVLPC